jgi:hypothetical protein
LAYARCKQGTKTLSFYTGLPNITYDRNSFSRKHVGVLYLLVKIHKKPSGKRQGVKKNITEMEAVRLKSSSVGLSDQLRRHEVRWVYLV